MTLAASTVRRGFLWICSAVVGEMDEDMDQGLDLSAIRAAPVKPVHH